ncbi:MAG: hypothetical protein NUW24_02805 [Anaerolineae bacterium]|nr:hypothetical protein [Anaerolineae bacterium]MDH7474900.1 hypothetical protein [Anaerolineae bacterium]
MARRIWLKFKRPGGAGNGPAYRSILDVGTTWAKTLVVAEQNGEARVIGRGRAHHRGAFAANGKIADANALAVACEAALCQAEDMTEETTGRKVVPDTAVIGIPCHWLAISCQTFVHRRRQPEVRVEEDEVERVVVRAGRLATQDLARRLSPTIASLTVVDASLVSLAIDGHRVTDPLGLQGGELAATVSVAAAPGEALAALYTLAEALELEPAYLVAEPQAMAHHLNRDSIVLDVGGMSTGVYLICNGKLLAADALPLGGDGFGQSLAAVFNLSGRQMQALQRAYEKGLLSEEDTAHVQAALRDTIQNWLQAVAGCLERMAVSEYLPHQIYLCGGGSRWPDVLEATRTYPWISRLPFARYPQIQRLDPVQLPGPINGTGRLWDVEETTALSLACWPVKSGDGPAERALAPLIKTVLT